MTPIYKIVVGYPWAKSDGNVTVPRDDKRWRSIKKIVDGVVKEVKSKIKTSFDTSGAVISIGRLRGMHGRPLLGDLISRVKAADLVILDIGSLQTEDRFNPNVVFELGMAIASHNEDSGRVYVLKPKDRNVFSDLNGYLLADYTADGSGIKLLDSSGFRAAVRSTVLNGLIEKGCITRKGAVGTGGVIDENFDDENHTNGGRDMKQRAVKGGRNTPRKPK